MTDLLTGWKEIMAYLKISEKTAKRYRKHRGLPITKDPAGHPVISKKDADKWRLKEQAA